MPSLSISWIVPDAMAVAMITWSPSAPPEKPEGKEDQKENKKEPERKWNKKDSGSREHTYSYCF